ncbi:MAG: hypothetical protein HYV45_02400 [Candidatus Moranbacteria bacterium]|nr:hypothetical protein [Candidatus Moranbacteria bacterium]
MKFITIVLFLFSQVCFGSEAFEYYNTQTNRFFWSSDAAEMAVINSGGAGPGWVLTGITMPVNNGGSIICRHYNKITKGHFFSQNCGILDPNDLNWKVEGQVFTAHVPMNGTCPAGTEPVRWIVNTPRSYEGTSYRFTTQQLVVDAFYRGGWNVGGIEFCVGAAAISPPPGSRLAGLTQMNVGQNQVVITLGFAGDFILSFIPPNREISLHDVAKICLDSDNVGWGDDSARCVAPDTNGVAVIKNTVSHDCVQVHLKLKSGEISWANVDKLVQVGWPAAKQQYPNGTQCLKY